MDFSVFLTVVPNTKVIITHTPKEHIACANIQLNPQDRVFTRRNKRLTH